LVGTDDVSVISPATPAFADVDSVRVVSATSIIGPAIVARSTFAPVGFELPTAPGALGYAAGGLTVAWVLGPDEPWRGPKEIADPVELKGLRLRGATDLITGTERMLEDDCASFRDQPGVVPAGCVVVGDPSLIVIRNALVEPHVVFDVRKGPIVLEADSLVRAGARLEGPIYLGPHSWILGGAVRHCAIGPHCRVHGEVANSVFLGYANKSHDGFVGHSVLGQWVNLGAGTITSNLKNTYGEVRLELPTGRVDTGRTNVGTLFGDHAKTAIGTLLNTGTIVGTGANVVANPVPRYVRPFAWALHDRQSLEGFLTVAGRVLPRRGVELTPEIAASLSSIHERLAG
jgi:UDP-N-acetylglucosamine diphosphorylase/glucosamine-1-phosphate N-acetyltransferase